MHAFKVEGRERRAIASKPANMTPSYSGLRKNKVIHLQNALLLW